MSNLTANFYWGNKILPFLRYLTLYSFRKYNPKCKMNLYFPKKLQENRSWTSPEHEIEMVGKDYFDKLEDLNISLIPFDMEDFGLSNEISEVKKADFLRWHLLSSERSLWSDMDILYVKTLIGFEKRNTISIHNGIWSIGFLTSTSAHMFFKYLYKRAFECINENEYQSIGSLMLKNIFGGTRTRASR